jgi:hypothetical protein
MKVTVNSCNNVENSFAHFYLLYGLNQQLHGHLNNYAQLSDFFYLCKQKLLRVPDSKCWCFFYCSYHRGNLRGRVSCGARHRQPHPIVLNHRCLHLLERQVGYEINRDLYCVNKSTTVIKIKSYKKGSLVSRRLYTVVIQGKDAL